MANRRRYGEDLTYAEWHRLELPEFYRRNGHRLDMADRDWTEACHYCREPLAVYEEVLDRGQDLSDKGTSITRNLGERAQIHALLVAPRISRPVEVQQEIDALNKEVRQLEALHPIDYFTVRRLYPNPSKFMRFTVDEWRGEIYRLHRFHHQDCRNATRDDPVDNGRATVERVASRIWIPNNLELPLEPVGTEPSRP